MSNPNLGGPNQVTDTPASDGVPDTLKTAAGLTWRFLVILAGVGVLVLGLGTIFPVVFALFFVNAGNRLDSTGHESHS